MTQAAIRAILDDHSSLSGRMDAGWRAVSDMDCRQPGDLRQLEDYFRENIREPILFQQTRLFPALLELEPGAEPIVRDARAEHVAVLTACGRLFMELALCVSSRTEHGASCRAKEHGRAILDEVIARLGRSDRLLSPLLHAHRSALEERLLAA